MWIWRRMMRISWTEKITNKEVLRRVGEKRFILAPGAGGPLGHPRATRTPRGPPGPPGPWTAQGARGHTEPPTPSAPLEGPQRPRGGGARKRTRGPLRAPRRPPGAWGLGAFSFQPPGGPKGSQVPIQQDPRAPRDPNPWPVWGAGEPEASSITPPKGLQDSWGPPGTGGGTRGS